MYEGEKKNADKGFSLVELIIVIAIIAVLGSMVSLGIIQYIENARQAIDVNNATLIRDALFEYNYPSDYPGQPVTFKDPKTGASETYTRGWVYVDKEEIRCSDASTAMAIIMAGLVEVSPETELIIRKSESSGVKKFPSGPDKDYLRRTGIGEYAFRRRSMLVKSRKIWNTYQLDVYVDGSSGEVVMGGSASNEERTNGHSKDEEAARVFQEKLGFDGSKVTPIGEQHGY